MKVFPHYLHSLVLFACFCSFCLDAVSMPKPALYNIQHLDEMKKRGLGDSLVINFLKRADVIVRSKPVTVVGKNHSFSNNTHDYCSLAPYSWPDEKNPGGPYITKDGIINPERNEYDYLKLSKLAERAQVLSIAFYITEDSRYYDAFKNHLRVWFLDESTYMEPNFEYAQVVKGKDGNKGQSYGLVDMKKLTQIIESILLVNSIRRFDKDFMSGLRTWFASLLSWMEQSQQWGKVSQSDNNILSSSLVIFAETARFIGNRRMIKQISREYTSKILVQIDDEGKQPAELRRTNAFGYSVGNLQNIVDFALIMEKSRVKYYKKNQKKIDSAFKYLSQFVDNHDSFPYKQIGPWGAFETRLMNNTCRLQRLSSKKSEVIEYSKSTSIEEPSNLLDYVY